MSSSSYRRIPVPDQIAMPSGSNASYAYALPNDRGQGYLSMILKVSSAASSPALTVQYQPVVIHSAASETNAMRILAAAEYSAPLAHGGSAVTVKTCDIYEAGAGAAAFSAVDVVDGYYICTFDFDDVPFDGLLLKFTEGNSGTGNMDLTFCIY